jgi:hypothetical protein
MISNHTSTWDCCQNIRRNMLAILVSYDLLAGMYVLCKHRYSPLEFGFRTSSNNTLEWKYIKWKTKAGLSGRAVWGTYCFRPLEHWDHGFESPSRHGCVSAFFCVALSYVGRSLASGWSPVQGVLPNVQQIHKFQKLKFWIKTGHDSLPWSWWWWIN